MTLNDLKCPYFQAGDRIAFYDNTAIREGNFLCSGHNHNLRKGLTSVLAAGHPVVRPGPWTGRPGTMKRRKP